MLLCWPFQARDQSLLLGGLRTIVILTLVHIPPIVLPRLFLRLLGQQIVASLIFLGQNNVVKVVLLRLTLIKVDSSRLHVLLPRRFHHCFLIACLLCRGHDLAAVRVVTTGGEHAIKMTRPVQIAHALAMACLLDQLVLGRPNLVLVQIAARLPNGLERLEGAALVYFTELRLLLLEHPQVEVGQLRLAQLVLVR